MMRYKKEMKSEEIDKRRDRETGIWPGLPRTRDLGYRESEKGTSVKRLHSIYQTQEQEAAGMSSLISDSSISQR